jgi:two-component system, NarL family, sensor histidine kinase DegS
MPKAIEPVVRIDAREARRLKERFLTRARAVFYARLAFLTLGLGILAIPTWRESFGADTPLAYPWYAFVVLYSVLAQVTAHHPRHGRWVMFLTLTLDLFLLLALIANSGGLRSPVMAGQVLFTLFFALLFPNPIATVPPLLMLPVVMRVSQMLGERPPFTVELLFLLWYAALNGVAVYVTVYLTGREEQQNREILELEGELKKLAVVEERNRLARDIHDGLGAALSGLIIQSEYLLTLARGDETMKREVSELKLAAEEAIDEVRRALSMMRDEFELIPQLENACTTFTTRHRTPVDLRIEGEQPPLSDDQQLTLFRIMQECLTNTAKHAEATRVTVQVRFSPTELTLCLEDDGKGFDPTKRPKGHYGLLNIKERARKVGGVVEIASELGEGTKVMLAIPARHAGALPQPP